MEAQVENKCKKTNKQINKEKKRKTYMYRLQSLKNCRSGEKEYWKERTYFELVPLA